MQRHYEADATNLQYASFVSWSNSENRTVRPPKSIIRLFTSFSDILEKNYDMVMKQ